MGLTIIIVLVLLVVAYGVRRSIASGTGKTPISTHDTVFAELPPGVIPPDPHAPTRPATEQDVAAPVAVRFEPPQGILPEQVGMLTSARVLPRDTTAAFVALAVEGYLHLEQFERPEMRLKSERREWMITTLKKPAPGEVHPGRRLMMLAMPPVGSGDTLRELKPVIRGNMPAIEGAIAKDPAHAEWYPRLRDGQLPFSATFGPGARERSATGAALRYQSAGFQEFLATADGDRLRFEEGAGIFSRYLPWAVAYGVTDQWVQAFQEAASDLSPEVSAAWSADLAWFGNFSSIGDFGAMDFANLGETLNDFASGISDLASDLSTGLADGGMGGADGGDGGGGDGGGGD